MIGLGFLLALIVYLLIAVTLAVWAPRAIFNTSRARTITGIAVLLTFVLIPTWDIIPGKLYFDHLCKTEGGLKIYKTVEGVEGLYQAEGGSGVAQSTLKYGYSFVEGTSLAGDLTRYTLDDAGGLHQQKIPKITSNYVVNRIVEPRSFNVFKTSYRISTAQGEQHALLSFLSHSGNWLQVKFSPLLGHGGDCPLQPPSFEDFYVGTLKPKK